LYEANKIVKELQTSVRLQNHRISERWAAEDYRMGSWWAIIILGPNIWAPVHSGNSELNHNFKQNHHKTTTLEADVLYQVGFAHLPVYNGTINYPI